MTGNDLLFVLKGLDYHFLSDFKVCIRSDTDQPLEENTKASTLQINFALKTITIWA